MASVLWQDLTAEELRDKAAKDAIVVLPVASIEQHGPHLPVGVDTVLCSGVCKAAAERASDVELVVAPTLWCGMAEHHMAFGGTFTFDIPTYRAVLLAFLKSIERHGFHRVLIVNGHGGNIAALTAFLPDFARETLLHVEATTYFMLAEAALGPLLEDQQGVQHACEVLPAASRAIGKAWSDSSGAACSAGVATITASNGPRRSPSSTSHHCRPSWTSPLTRQSNVTSC